MSHDPVCGAASCALGQKHFKSVALVEKTLPMILTHLGLVILGWGGRGGPVAHILPVSLEQW